MEGGENLARDRAGNRSSRSSIVHFYSNNRGFAPKTFLRVEVIEVIEVIEGAAEKPPSPAKGGAMPSEHLSDPPSAAFWVSELGFARFPAYVPLLNDQQGLSEALHDAWTGPTPSKVLAMLLEAHGDTMAAKLHLLLVAEFLKGKKTSAVRDVARACGVEEQAKAMGYNGDRVPRLPVAAWLYCKDPRCLVAMDACHRWHSSRRAAMELGGPRRKLPEPMADLDWDGMGASAVEAMPSSLRASYRPRYELAVPRDHGNEVLLAFREPAEYATVKDDNGDVVAGRKERWTILRFYRGALRVDVTAYNHRLGVALADAVANRIWPVEPPLQYRPAKGELTREDLQVFLERLRDPEDDRFQLLEITARATALAEQPDICVAGAGQARAEAALQELRRNMAFAERWETVRQVKLGFEGRYRVTVQFPAPGEPLRLTYSDAERDKDACKAFEKMFLDELGVRILPRVAGRGGRRRRSTEAPQPRKPGPATWRRLLSPVLDDPLRWEASLVRGLADRALVKLTEHSFFRCGDPYARRDAASGPGDSLDCPGEIEMPYGALDPNDPHRQEDDAEYTCSRCGRPWYPGRYRLDLTHRMRTRVEHEEFWAFLLEKAGKQGRFEEEAPGVASGMVAGTRTYLVYLPLAPEPWHEPAHFLGFRAAWVSVPGDPRLERHGDSGMDLGEFLGDDSALARRLTAKMPSSYTQEQVLSMAASMPGQLAAQSRGRLSADPGEGEVQMPEHVRISRDSKGVWVGTTNVAGPRAKGMVKILALLQHCAELDAKTGRERRFRSAASLARLVRDLKYQTVRTWISRARGMVDKATGCRGLGASVIEGGERGYRLGLPYECLGFELKNAFES